MRPALDYMVLRSDDRDLTKLDGFAIDAVHDFIKKIENLDESILSNEVKAKVVDKLKKTTVTKLFISNFTDQRLEEYYEELNLKGDENLIKSAMEIHYFYKKVILDYKGSKSSLDKLAQFKTVHYNRFNQELSNYLNG